VSSPSEAGAAGVSERHALPALPRATVSQRERALGYWRYLKTLEGQRRAAWFVVYLAAALFILFVGQHALVRHIAYHDDGFDMGNMDQAVWNTLHGHPFRFTNRAEDWNGPPTRLGIHVEPILLLIAPLYLIHSGPVTLIALQTVAFALGALPLFLLGLRRLPALPLVAAALAVAYLAAPAVLGAALWDFHAVALATPLLLAAILALDARRFGWFVLAALLAMLTKEDVGLSLIPLGLYIALWLRRPRLGGAVAVVALVWVALCFAVILPHFNGGASGGNTYWYRYAQFGATPKDAVINILTHPWLPLTFVLGDAARRAYLGIVLRMGGGLGIFAPLLWISALPELAVNTLSGHAEQYSGFFQYNAMLGAYLMAASVYGVAALYDARQRAEAAAPSAASHADASPPAEAQAHRPIREKESGHSIPPPLLPARIQALLKRMGARWRRALERLPIPSRWLPWLVVAWLLVAGVWNLAAIQPRLGDFWGVGAAANPQQPAIDALLARVPADASVAATDTLNPHLSDRYTIYLLPDPQSYTAEYVAFDIPNASPERQADDQRIYDRMLASGRYHIVGSAGSAMLLRRTGAPLAPPA
jgi:uncharacterized membrane protein